MNKIFTGTFILGMLFLVSCESLMDPVPENISDDSRILKDAAFAEGLILNAYTRLPSSYNYNEAATDDAVANTQANIYSRMASGEWSSQFNPVSSWDDSYEQIFYLNYFINMAPQIEFSWQSKTRDEMFRKRFTGEAKALRAWYNFQLLRSHGGIADDNNPFGFIIVKNEDLISMEKDKLLSLPRSSYQECVQFILSDINDAISLLPNTYKNYTDTDSTKVLGAQNVNRINGLAAKALKARVLLHAASQPFASGYAMEDAADAAAALLKDIGGINAIQPSSFVWYKNKDDADIIWRRDYADINSWERDNFPPSLFGNGLVNPTQNLVDVFPMANGYPIHRTESQYDESNPYANRDSRLKAYILYNGNTIGTKAINTTKQSATDGINNTVLSTRTGYYLKKLMNEQVNLAPNVNSIQRHFYTFFRYTEMFLIYAEAANEAWGPESDPKGNGFTAKDVIANLRKRAGIVQPDDYLAEKSTYKEDLKELIRNERRIELCFEGFRFWDLRRWDLPLNEPAKGMLIDNGVYTLISNVENRAYQPHMKYGPIPYGETLKNKNLVQNKGW